MFSLPRTVVMTLVGFVVSFIAASVAVVAGLVPLLGVATGAIYASLAFIALVRIHRAGLAEDGWLVTVVVAVAAASVMRASAPSTDGLINAGAGLLRCTAFGLACTGSVGMLSVRAARHRSSAFQSSVERAEEVDLRRHLEEDYAGRLHEVRSSVLALHGGVRTLEPDADRDVRLRAALEAELIRLQELVAPVDPAVQGIPFHLADAVVPTLEVCKAAGMPVAWDVSGQVDALGRPARCAQIVHALVANAHRHAPRTPIDVTAAADGSHVMLRVEDRGPGVPHSLRDEIFERGVRGTTDTNGLGLGLAIARGLAHDQGGDLWVESRPGGGAAFVLLLPKAHDQNETARLRVV